MLNTRILPFLLLSFAAPAWAATVNITVDGSKPTPISPYIYGWNAPNWSKGAGITLTRFGGNRITAYNWIKNASNAGSDWHFQNDAFLSSSTLPAAPVKSLILQARAHAASVVISVPMLGYVSADKNGDGDVSKTPDFLKTRFLESLPKKPTPFSDTPDLSGKKVYQDEFVHFLEKTFPDSRKDDSRTLFYALDNEPDLWADTHKVIHPEKVTYQELLDKTVAYASAIKAAAPTALVFGPVSYGWSGYVTLQGAPDAKDRDFLDTYMDHIRQADKAAGHRLVDVLDLHWYPEAQANGKRITEDDTSPPVVEAREQAPRSLWDPAYKENSWIVRDGGAGPIRLLPRMMEKIAKHDPGMKLAITEYYYGAGGDISGGIAEAEALGIFGREGLFAAAVWHMGKSDQRFIYGALAMYRNYDDQGAAFGDTSLPATTSDPALTSAYASKNAAGDLVLVLINKATEPTNLKLSLNACDVHGKTHTYELGPNGKPRPGKDLALSPANTLETQMPAQSVWTVVISKR